MMYKSLFLLFAFVSSESFVVSLKCFLSPSPLVLNYTVTIDTLPSFANNVLSDTSDQCTLTIIWLRDPLGSMIIFGTSSLPKDDSFISSDSILTSVQLQLEGDELIRRLSRDIQFKCQSSNGCNNEKNLKRILNSLRLEEEFYQKFNLLIKNNSSFNNQSISKCYSYQNSTNHCSKIDYLNCRRCEISIDFSNSSNNPICATCPTESSDFNSIKRDAIFIVNNRSQIVDRVQLWCQNGEQCNSIENIYQIRQSSHIDLDFDKYFHSSSSIYFLSMTLLLITLFTGLILKSI